MKFNVLIILLISTAFSHFSIKDGQVYNILSNQYYSDDEFIDLLNIDSNFIDDKDFKKYKKSNKKLKFRSSWYIYLLSIGSIGAGIEGIQYPERWEQGGENYDSPDDSAPGYNNVLIGVLLPTSYFGYHKIRKDRSRYHIINKYNILYSETDVESENIPFSFVDDTQKFWETNIWNSKQWYGSVSTGFLSEKIPYSLIDISIIYDKNQNSEFYGTFSSIIFGGGLSVGHKYHFFNKSESTPFISSSIYTIGGGDTWEVINGISIAPGFSLVVPDWLSSKIKGEYRKKSINFGCTVMYMFDNSYGYFPFLNFEVKF